MHSMLDVGVLFQYSKGNMGMQSLIMQISLLL
jgi:hypothetical protein